MSDLYGEELETKGFLGGDGEDALGGGLLVGLKEEFGRVGEHNSP